MLEDPGAVPSGVGSLGVSEVTFVVLEVGELVEALVVGPSKQRVVLHDIGLVGVEDSLATSVLGSAIALEDGGGRGRGGGLGESGGTY